MQDWSKYVERPYKEVLEELRAKGYELDDAEWYTYEIYDEEGKLLTDDCE